MLTPEQEKMIAMRNEKYKKIFHKSNTEVIRNVPVESDENYGSFVEYCKEHPIQKKGVFYG